MRGGEVVWDQGVRLFGAGVTEKGLTSFGGAGKRRNGEVATPESDEIRSTGSGVLVGRGGARFDRNSAYV